MGYSMVGDIGIAFLVIFGPAMYFVAWYLAHKCKKLQEENEELKDDLAALNFEDSQKGVFPIHVHRPEEIIAKDYVLTTSDNSGVVVWKGSKRCV